MKYIVLILCSIYMFVSCKSSDDKIEGMLSEYVKNIVKNPNSVDIHKFQVYDKVYNSKAGMFLWEKSKNNTITEKSDYINFLFSAKNSDGIEIFREASVYFDKAKKTFISSYPENIDIENGNISGTCKYYFGNLITNWQIRNYNNDANVIIMNVDTLGGRKKYITTVQNGTYQVNKIIPGYYFFKLINYNINLENIYGNYGNKKNYFMLSEIQKIMNFYRIYSSIPYGYSDKKLFDETLKKLDKYSEESNETEFSDNDVNDIWKDFKKSVNHKFLDDFEIEYDYRYLNEFDKILIESSTPTNHDVYIKNFFY